MAVTYFTELLGITLQGVHKQFRTNNVSCPKLGQKAYINGTVARNLFKFKFEKKKIAFQIVKGGTGKTTAIHNISCAASLYGARILLIDLDPQGNLTDSFAVDAEDIPVLIDIVEKQAKIQDAIVNVTDGIDLIPSRIENVTLDSKLAMNRIPLHTWLNHIMSPVEKNYDFIFIDCPPMMGHAVTAASLYSDLILVPLNPDKFSAKGLKILKNEILNISKQYEKNIGYKVFLNKYSGNTILSDKAIQTTIAAETELGNALNTAVRQAQEIPNVVDMDMNVFSTLKRSTARDDFDLLARELLNINEHLNEYRTRYRIY